MSTAATPAFERAERSSSRRRRGGEAARTRDLLRAEILSGSHGDQSLLAAESQLVREYAVGRNVVRDALDQLRAEGLVERIQGSGTFVLSTKVQHHFNRVHAIHDSVQKSGRVSGAVLSMRAIAAPRPVAEHLHIQLGDECTLIEYTAIISGTPFSMSTSYVPVEVGARVDCRAFAGDFYQWLEFSGFTVAGGHLSVEAVLADERSAAALRIASGSPLLLFQRNLASRDGTPLEVGFVRCRGDRLSLRIQLPRSVKENSS